MASNNLCFFEGRLTYEPELKKTSSGTFVINFQIAAPRPYQKDKEQKSDFIDCQAWRGTAEFIANNFHKGDPIKVQAAVQTSEYTDKNGNNRKGVVFVIQDVSFVIGAAKRDNSQAQTNNSAPEAQFNNPAPAQATPPTTDFEEIVDDDDDDLPF
ncbi:MAG: single-stranded DNA-binding protein [Eubacterium sp.]|nr:single-stranded DNA-binding protein [Eubacterium sp.]MBR1531682.1 single-stranded DNA-binding protein [Eubacterium sp.]